MFYVDTGCALGINTVQFSVHFISFPFEELLSNSDTKFEYHSITSQGF